MEIDKASVVPIYYQLRTLIERRIASGQYLIGACLPSEREFCETYQISRMTVRQAINDLVKEGFLRREQGKGTYVAKPKIEQGLSRLTSFTEDMHSRNLQPGTKLIQFNLSSAMGRIAKRLHLSDGEEVYEIIRLRLADGEPMAIETAYVPVKFAPGLPAERMAAGSLYAMLTEQGIQLCHADQTLEAATARTYEAEYLHIRPRDPVLLIERTTFDDSGNPVEFVKSVYRGDRYKFSIKLTMPSE